MPSNPLWWVYLIGLVFILISLSSCGYQPELTPVMQEEGSGKAAFAFFLFAMFMVFFFFEKLMEVGE